MEAIDVSEWTVITNARAAQQRKERRRLVLLATRRDVAIPASVLTQLTTEELYAALGVRNRSVDPDHTETSAVLDRSIT